MELAIIVWLVSVIGKIAIICEVTGFMMFVMTIGVIAANKLDSTLGIPIARLRTWIICAAVALGMGLVLPSKETVWLMLGAYTAQTVYDSDTGVLLKKVVDIKLREIVDTSAKK